MKAFVVNASPRMANGNTAVILNPFVEGMRVAGAEVDVAYAQRLKIRPCLGCLNCVTKTPGHCVQKDDMEAVLIKYASSDAIVWATPLYVDGPTAQMKTIVDRLLPGAGTNPGYEVRDGHQRLKAVSNDATPKLVVLVATCGLHEMDNFDALVQFMEAFSRDAGFSLAGTLLRPHANVLLGLGPEIADILQAANDAGQQFVRDGRIAENTSAIVSRELLPRDVYVEACNSYIEGERRKNIGSA